jgi:hypothetical protein
MLASAHGDLLRKETDLPLVMAKFVLAVKAIPSDFMRGPQ